GQQHRIQPEEVFDLAVFALDGRGRGDHLHPDTATVRAGAGTKPALGHPEDALVVAGESPEFLVHHMQFVDDLEGRARVVQGRRELRHGVRWMTLGAPLVAFPAAAEAVQRTLAVDIAKKGAETVCQPDVRQLVEGADNEGRQVPVDLRIDYVDG